MKRYLLSMLLLTALLVSAGAAMRAPTALAGDAVPADSASPSASARYTITDLGTLGGASEAFAISNNGQVAGRYATGSGYTFQAFFWKDGVMQGLGTLGGDSSEAYGVNNDGQVAGTSKTSSGYTAAFRWQNGSMQNLGTLGGSMSGAFGINNSGQVVGFAINSTDQMRAFLWSGGMADLGALSGGDTSYAYGVNDAGQVAGWSRIGTWPSWNDHAFLWSGSMQDLGTLGWVHSIARGINDNGDVVGYLAKNNWENEWHAFVSQGGGMQDLGGTLSVAADINNAGLIVGESGGHAVLWENGQVQDLNTLIPANSGWVLQSARGINNKGQIVGKGTFNGQTRAFLLKTQAYNWINPSGGSWHLTTNWDPQGDPGDGDTVIFGLSGQYTVDASAVAAAAGPAVNFPVGRAIISGTNTVEFVNLSLNLLDDSVTEPALTVDDGGTVKITSGVGTMIHAVIGGAPPANPSNPPIARLQVFNSGTSLNGTGRLSIGDEGAGDLFVANGGHLTSAEARLGGLLPTAPGTAVVGGDGSLWQTGNIAVGYGVSGNLAIENGGRVDSNTAAIGFGSDSSGSLVTIDGTAPGGNPPSLWTVEGDLTIGNGDSGLVDVLNGGQLAVNQNVDITDGALTINGRLVNGSPSYLAVMDTVLVGGTNGSVLAFYDGARGEIYGDLILGQSGIGNLLLTQVPGFSGSTNLYVDDSLFGTCLIGREFMGEAIINTGSSLGCRNVELGLAGTGGIGIITLDGGYLSASEIVRVGQATSGGGWIEMGNNATVVAGVGMHIAPNGLVSGSGQIFLGSIGLVNEGVLSPGITLITPLATAPQSLVVAQDSRATMAITGTLTISPTGRLEIPLTGSGAGQYGSLAVSGAAHLDGVLALDFRNGYTPRQGDTFTFLAATGGVSGAFDDVEISGLPPGFQYELTVENGQVTLEALSGGAPAGRMFLPLMMRRR